jgi:hypothetical protein
MSTPNKKKSPNHYTIYSGDGPRVLLESDGIKSSETITAGDGRVLSKRENRNEER